jgi:hypothetical protein
MRVACRSADDIEWLLRALAERSGVEMPGPVKTLIFPMFDIWIKALGVAVVVVLPEKKVKYGRGHRRIADQGGQ